MSDPGESWPASCPRCLCYFWSIVFVRKHVLCAERVHHCMHAKGGAGAPGVHPIPLSLTRLLPRHFTSVSDSPQWDTQGVDFTRARAAS
jgi:hypothetical protein